MPSISLQPILDAALADYAKQIGIDPAKHPFADQLHTCHSADDVLKLLEDKANEFKNYREGNRRLIDCLQPVVKVVHAFSGVLGEAVSLSPFPPAKAIFVGVDVLLAAADGVSSSYDALVDLFECVGNFLKRLRIYAEIPLTPSMAEIVIKIMVELLSVLALATKQIKQGRFKKFAQKLLGESKIEAVLHRLDRLTQEEGRMTAAQTLEVVHCLMNNVKVVMNDGKVSTDGIWRALYTMQQMATDINKIRRDQLKKESRIWLSPPDPSPNYNDACETHQDGTAMWFIQGNVFAEWNAKGSLLWIYGNSGSGKTILMSSIIQEIDRLRRAGLALMAYFFFDFRDTQKQHRRGLLSSLIFQLSAESDDCNHIFSQLYSDHDEGTRQPSDDALFHCLTKMLEVQRQPAIYIIIDALDESPNISGMPTQRENVLDFLENFAGLQLPNVHVCVSSRPEYDIRSILEPLALFHVSLHEESGQRSDISGYINSVVHSDRKMRQWSAEVKQLVIDTLSDKADGMFRWVYCQLETLRRCFPSSIRSTLVGLPKTLDAAYERTLLRIDEEKRQFANRLFQCLAVSVRPLRIEELAEILAVRFDAGALPQFNAGWRLGNAEEAVLSACSSLITVVNVGGSRFVQFSHFSVKEFLTSDRLASSKNLSLYHIVLHMAHATLAQASLSVLLQLHDRIDKQSIRNFPLADYAARHWFEHGRFENVSPTIQDATKCLFDREKPHLSAWIWLYDMDDPWREPIPTKHPELPEAGPLYYAILCGFHWLIEHLIDIYPGDVDARGGYHETPLLAAVRKDDVNLSFSSQHIDIVRLLLDHNADVNLTNDLRKTPLDWASKSGNLELSQLLVQRGADVHSRTNVDWTPIQRASHHGHLDVVRFLIDSGADVGPRDHEGRTPLHSASRQGHVDVVEFLIQRGADVNEKSDSQVTPLHLASMGGKLEILKLLVQRGADVHSQEMGGCTPLKTASHHGHLDVVRFLIDSGADVNSHDNEGSTPLHSASQEGHINIVELLIQHSAYINKKNDNQATPLYLASANGMLDILQLLVQQGADVESRDKNDWTPLKAASHHGHLDVVRFLINSGADVNSRDNEDWSPMHSAATNGHRGVAETLLEHGADSSIRKHRDRTSLDPASDTGKLEVADFPPGHMAGPMSLDGAVNTTPPTTNPKNRLPHVLHPPRKRAEDVTSSDNEQCSVYAASMNGQLDIVRSLLDRGFDVNERNSIRETALNAASRYGNLEVAKLLIERGADVDSRNRHGWTPLISASRYGQLDVARLLLDHGANVNTKTRDPLTALHLASNYGHLEMVQLLLERGANADVRKVNGQTARQLAIRLGHRKVAELLSSFGEHGQGVIVQATGSHQ